MTVDLHILCEQFRQLKPPQQRDRLIFEAVAVKQRSQTEVAREHGISQPRVAQIVVEVGRWVARVVPQAHDQLSQEERLGLASFLVESQLRYWQDLVTTAWTTSGENKVVLKETARKDGSIVREEMTIPQGRKIGFLNAGMRLALALARLSGVDTSGRTQRMAAMAEAAARKANVNVGRPSQALPHAEANVQDGLGSPSYETEVPSDDAEKELIGETENSAATEPADSSQDECLPLDTRFHWTLEEEREATVNGLMKNTSSRLPRGERRRMHREWERRRAEASRREFLKPLATG